MLPHPPTMHAAMTMAGRSNGRRNNCPRFPTETAIRREITGNADPNFWTPLPVEAQAGKLGRRDFAGVRRIQLALGRSEARYQTPVPRSKAVGLAANRSFHSLGAGSSTRLEGWTEIRQARLPGRIEGRRPGAGARR